jgi:hypothetical protein
MLAVTMSRPEKLRYDFDFLYYQDGDVVVAHCLQTDTAAFGADIASAREALRASLELEIASAIEDGDAQRVYASRAPDEFWDKAADAERHLYVVDLFRVPGPQRVDLKEHVLAGVA